MGKTQSKQGGKAGNIKKATNLTLDPVVKARATEIAETYYGISLSELVNRQLQDVIRKANDRERKAS